MNKDQRGKYVRQKANLRVGRKEQTDVVNNITLVFLTVKSQDIVCYQNCLKWKKKTWLYITATKPKFLLINDGER